MKTRGEAHIEQGKYILLNGNFKWFMGILIMLGVTANTTVFGFVRNTDAKLNKETVDIRKDIVEGDMRLEAKLEHRLERLEAKMDKIYEAVRR